MADAVIQFSDSGVLIDQTAAAVTGATVFASPAITFKPTVAAVTFNIVSDVSGAFSVERYIGPINPTNQVLLDANFVQIDTAAVVGGTPQLKVLASTAAPNEALYPLRVKFDPTPASGTATIQVICKARFN